jgi:integrase
MSVKVRKIYGDTWGIIIHHQGKRWQQAVGGKRAAEIMAAEMQIELAKGRVGVPGEIPTMIEYAATWLEYVELRRAPRTFSRYRGLVEKINKHIGSKAIDKITRGDIRDLLLKEYKAGAAKATIELMHAVLSGIFNHAIDDNLIAVVPTTRILAKLDLSTIDEEIKPLSAAEMNEALAALDPFTYPVFKLLFETGCRIGEALALTWGDIDFRNQKITFCKTSKDQEIRRTTKTNTSRTIDMSDSLLLVLMEQKKVDRETCLKQGVKQAAVFHNHGRLLSDNTLRRKWAAACERIGIGHRRMHDIRHTTASLLLARNAPITYVSKLLGHSSPTITLNKYAHYIPSENKGLVNLLETTTEIHCAGPAFDAQKQPKNGTCG